MNSQTEELIRQKAFELSQSPDRSGVSDIENWLDAERLIAGGLAEVKGGYKARKTTTADRPIPSDTIVKERAPAKARRPRASAKK